MSSDVTVERSVVRRTLANPGIAYNPGIVSVRLATSSLPSRLVLRDSLLHDNPLGVYLEGGSEGTLERTVVRDTRVPAGSQGKGGVAVSARGYGAQTPATRLTLSRCLVTGSVPDERTSAAVDVDGNAVATLERAVVRDTRSGSGSGMGVNFSNQDGRSRVTLRDCLVAGNHHTGVGASGGQLTLERSVVRDTRAVLASCQGWGVLGFYMEDKRRRTTLTLSDVVLAGNPSGGVACGGGDAVLRRVLVRGDPRRRCKGINEGFGVTVQPHVTASGLAVPSKLIVEQSLISDSGGEGLSVRGSTASVRTTEVRLTSGTAGGGYGDGVAVAGQGSSLALLDSLVSRSRRAGLLVRGEARGTVRRTVFTRNVFPIYLDASAPFTAGDDNAFVDNTEDRVTSGSKLKPTPLPRYVPSSFK